MPVAPVEIPHARLDVPRLPVHLCAARDTAALRRRRLHACPLVRICQQPAPLALRRAAHQRARRRQRPLGPHRALGAHHTASWRGPASKLSECAIREPRCPKTVSRCANEMICSLTRVCGSWSARGRARTVCFRLSVRARVCCPDLRPKSIEAFLHLFLIRFHDP